jgi:4-amino-4-deoxy-L-arabinose transferase-like glycosyltransferase
MGFLRPTSRWWALAAAVWLTLFLGVFFFLELPNNRPIVRWQIWTIVPELLDFIDPPPAPPGEHSGWEYFPQRFDLLAVMAVILAGAWGAGHLLLRALRLSRGLAPAEQTVFAFGIGLSALSLATLLLGFAGILSRPVLGSFVALCFIAGLAMRLLPPFARGGWGGGAGDKPVTEQSAAPIAATTTRKSEIPNPKSQILTPAHWAVLATLAPFLLATLLAALLPSTDFDVNEYHFQGPKEFFLAGRVGFLEHNVYTSFPFGTEMLTLLAMVLRGDWYRGALAGKGVLMCFGLFTGLALFAAGRRWFGTTAGVLAAVFYLSTPWIFRISTIAYAEGGLCFYLFAALLALMIAIDWRSAGEALHPTLKVAHVRMFALAGLLAGSGMACKYPGLVSVVIPLGMAAVWNVVTCRGKSLWIVPATFVTGVVLTVGPWLAKNLIETGNPVYPLAWSVFGGRDWDAAIDARWHKAHSPPDYSLASLGGLMLDVALRNDWVNPLLFAFAPLALVAGTARRRAAWLWLYVGWLVFSCWLFTHRIDRFWVPLLPVAALLSGGGAAWWCHAMQSGFAEMAPALRRTGGRSWLVRLDLLLGWSLAVIPFVALGLFNLEFIAGVRGYCGYNDFLRDLDEAGRVAGQHTAPEIVWMNGQLPTGSKVLSVGDAATFEARFPVVYNTVFDRSIFEDWFAARPGEASDGAELREAESIQKVLADEGITHVYVCWREILRYRSPGNYGYSEFVTPERFGALRRMRILNAPLPLPQAVNDLDHLDPAQRQVIERWGRALITGPDQHPQYTTAQVFPVVK